MATESTRGSDRLPRYYPALDGVRAVAILAVFFFHLKVRFFSLGGYGVQLFFVLSGFLITGILLDTKKAVNYYGSFYTRRCLRIFPIYYITLLVVLTAGLARGEPAEHTPFYLVYLQNFIQAFTGFGERFPGGFGHSWTLAIEEQFYFLWPLLVARLSLSGLMKLAVALIALAPVFREAMAGVSGNPYLQNTLLLSQVDMLAFGGLVACALRAGLRLEALEKAGRWAFVVAAGALVAMLATAGAEPMRTVGSGWFRATQAAVGPLFGATLLLLALAQMRGRAILPVRAAQLLLESRPMRHIGRVSYGLYLYHTPVFLVVVWAFDRWGGWELPHLARLGIKLGAVYAVALLSWRFVEGPILSLKDRFAAKSEPAAPEAASAAPAVAAEPVESLAVR